MHGGWETFDCNHRLSQKRYEIGPHLQVGSHVVADRSIDPCRFRRPFVTLKRDKKYILLLFDLEEPNSACGKECMGGSATPQGDVFRSVLRNGGFVIRTPTLKPRRGFWPRASEHPMEQLCIRCGAYCVTRTS